jgi:hypothetical protein
MATKTSAIARGLGCGGGGHERAVFKIWSPRWANGPAIDARGADAREEAPVVASIAGLNGPITD